MSIAGVYKFHSILSLEGEDKKYISAEELLSKPFPADMSPDYVAHEKASNLALTKTILKINEDGTLKALQAIPEGVTQAQIDEAVAAGEVTIEDGLIVEKIYKWEERDGVLLYDTGMRNLEDDDPNSGWAKLTDDEGYVSFMFMRFVKD